MAAPSRVDRALDGLAALRDSLRGAGNRERAGRFSCRGCVGWCCREGFNSMRATPLEAEAAVRLLEGRGEAGAAGRACAEAVARWRLAREGPGGRRTYTCPFLTAGNLCGVHAAKPLGCITFTPVRDGGCDQDLPLLGDAVDRVAELNDAAFGRGRWKDLPFPVAVLEALERRGPAAAGRRRKPPPSGDRPGGQARPS